MKISLLTVAFSLLTAAGIVALARWFHPATFSLHILTVLLALFAVSSVFYLWRHE
ncbi:MAG: hypothetical protein AAB538_00205 [Patescibacteria group bacterium]|mgnify:CR=1 FL=1